ncbi:hypothetical protein TWF281_000729 [Arthrobotrys megalospora]
MSPRLIKLLASYQSTLKYLYIQKINRVHKLKDGVSSVFSKFSSLKGFSWQGIRLPDEVPMVFDTLRASAVSLESFGLTIDSQEKLSFTNRTQNMIQLFQEWDNCLESEKVVLASLVEYQTPGPQLHLHELLLSSQIQRLYLTGEVDKQSIEELLLSFSGLVEINVVYRREIPSKEAILRHGETLRVLSVCSGSRGRTLPAVWSTQDLVEIGSGCPRLAELGISQNSYSRYCAGYTDIINAGQFSSSNMADIDFPRHCFGNLELLYISLPYLQNGTDSRIRGDISSNPLPAADEILNSLEESLNRYGPKCKSSILLALSKKLKVVVLGVGRIETNADFGIDPMIWKTIYEFPTAEMVTLTRFNIWNMLDSGFLANWKLLRRYPLMIPTEGL